jgi:Ca2+-transporting ATPase
VSIVIVIGYTRSLGIDNDVEHARTMALAALIVASATITAGLSRLRSRSSTIAVVATLVSGVILSQVPPIASLLHLSPLHLDDWLIAGFGGLLAGSLAGLLPSIAIFGHFKS